MTRLGQVVPRRLPYGPGPGSSASRTLSEITAQASSAMGTHGWTARFPRHTLLLQEFLRFEQMRIYTVKVLNASTMGSRVGAQHGRRIGMPKLVRHDRSGDSGLAGSLGLSNSSPRSFSSDGRRRSRQVYSASPLPPRPHTFPREKLLADTKTGK